MASSDEERAPEVNPPGGAIQIQADVLDETLNRCGRARAMTVLTPVKPWYLPPGGTLWVRIVFLVARWKTCEPGDIEELSFIHFARWGLICRIPDVGQPTEHLRQPLFMFESNYNGSFDQYIDAFAYILTSGITYFWGSSYGFPKPKPVASFKRYIHANEYVAQHYYSAYPTATTTMIVSALVLAERHRAFRKDAGSFSPQQFAVAYRKLLTETQDKPGKRSRRAVSFPRRAAAVLGALRRGPGSGSRSGRSYAFTSLTPICTGRERELAVHLRGLPVAEHSPLARMPFVHLGRWLIIDRLKMEWPGAPPRPTRLRSSYLLFTAAVTGPEDGTYADDLPESFLRELAAGIPEEADAIWGACVGYPGRAPIDDFVEYLRRSQLDTVLFHVGYPNATVEEVNRALAARDRLVGFAQSHQDEDNPAYLQNAYLEESATWLV